MRAPSSPVVLSSLLLAGWLTGASAQDTDIGVQPGWAAALDSQVAGRDSTSPGTIPQPTPAEPGVVWGVTLGELYSDNLTLAASGAPKDNAWVTQVEPFVRAAIGTRRFSGLVNYSLTGYAYAGESDRNQVAQNLRAQGTLTVLPQHLFVDGTTIYGRQILDPALASGSGTFYLGRNRANVARATLSPYWLQDLGRAGHMLVRYTHGRVVYNDRGIPDQDSSIIAGIPNTSSDAAQFSLVSPEGEAWGWNLNYSEQRLDPDFGQSLNFASATAGVSRQVSPHLRLLVDSGKENKYLPDGTTERLGAWFWDAGFEWSGARNRMRLLVGHRFYGHSYRFSWTHTAALLTTTVAYVEQPTDLNQQLLGQSPGSMVAFPIRMPRFPSLLERRVYLMKRGTLTATYEMPTSRLRLTLYDESRDYFLSDYGRDKVANANLAWIFDIGPFTTLTPRFGWQRYQFRHPRIDHPNFGELPVAGGQQDQFRPPQVNYTRFAELALVHQISPADFGSIRLRSDWRSVYAPLGGAHGYRTNVLFVQWTHLF